MPFMVGALAGGMAIYWGIATVIAKRLGRSGLPLTLTFAASLGTMEWLRGHLLTGFPWAAPGLVADGMGGLAQAASVIGMTGLTVMIVLWAGLPYVLLFIRGRLATVPSVVLFLLLPMAWGMGVWRLAGAEQDFVPDVVVRLVQPNIGQQEKWREDNARTIFDQLKALSSSATPEHPDGIASITHVIWPESAVPFFIAESNVAKAELKPLLGGHTVLITGSLRRDAVKGDGSSRRVYNSVITFDSRGEIAAVYDKWRLVPGGEFLPFEWLLEPLGFRKVVTVPGSFAAGPGPVTLGVPGLPPTAMLVCYEVIFPHRLVDPDNRPALLINVTNDGWFGQSTGPYQHLAQARMRAIEQGMPLLRAANTGISAVIDSYGRITARLPLMEEGVLDSPLPKAITATIYGCYGDALAGLLMAICLIMGLSTRERSG
jgi:apolipoprotein N-acyltransferase